MSSSLSPQSGIVVGTAGPQFVRVENIRVAADIGVHPYEVGRRQTLIVAVTVAISPVKCDELSETIDYNLIVTAARELAEQHTALIEIYARRLALACLDHCKVIYADVRVDKPGALANGLASTQLRLSRDE